MTAVTREDREMLTDAARGWVGERAPTSLVRAGRSDRVASGYDADLYREMAEMGWTGMIVPEAYAGHDFGFESMGMLMEELGRTLTASPIIPSAVTVASALVLAGTEEQKMCLLPRLVKAESIGTLALEEGARHDPTRVVLRATRSGEQWILAGQKRPVEIGMAADVLLVVARTSGDPGDRAGITLFLCEGSAPGVERHALTQIDSRGAASISFNDVSMAPERVLGGVDQGADLLDRVLDRTRAVAAAEMLGGMQRAFDTTMDYLKTREQFGQLIGSFQALQHRAADLLGEIELARSAVYAALAAIDGETEEIPLLVSIAKAMAGRTFQHVIREMVQMHGGIAMTDEHDAGLYLKRAQAADVSGGNAAFHRERFARLIGL